MRLQSKRAAVRLAIVSLLAVVTVSPCTQKANAAPSQAAAPLRQLVTEPMVWMVPTEYGYMPAEHVQPTLWIEGAPRTRYVVEKPGMEKAFTLGRER